MENDNTQQEQAVNIFTPGWDWTGATCVGKPEEWCPSEDLMKTDEWTKKIAPAAAQKCLGCPLFEQCGRYLESELDKPDTPLAGVLSGVLVYQKSDAQIRKALDRARNLHDSPSPAPTRKRKSKAGSGSKR